MGCLRTRHYFYKAVLTVKGLPIGGGESGRCHRGHGAANHVAVGIITRRVGSVAPCGTSYRMFFGGVVGVVGRAPCLGQAGDVAEAVVGKALAIGVGHTADGGGVGGQQAVEVIVDEGLGLGTAVVLLAQGEDVAHFVVGVAKIGARIGGGAMLDGLQAVVVVACGSSGGVVVIGGVEVASGAGNVGDLPHAIVGYVAHQIRAAHTQAVFAHAVIANGGHLPAGVGDACRAV